MFYCSLNNDVFISILFCAAHTKGSWNVGLCVFICLLANTYVIIKWYFNSRASKKLLEILVQRFANKRDRREILEKGVVFTAGYIIPLQTRGCLLV